MNCCLNIKINMRETPHGVQRSWRILFAFVCMCVVSKNTKFPNWSSIADNAVTRGGRSFGISFLLPMVYTQVFECAVKCRLMLLPNRNCTHWSAVLKYVIKVVSWETVGFHCILFISKILDYNLYISDPAVPKLSFPCCILEKCNKPLLYVCNNPSPSPGK